MLIVCHGEVMRAFQVRLERLSQVRFKELVFSKHAADRIHNCQILHYTRNNPKSRERNQYAGWTRWIRPTDTPLATSGWQVIRRPTYSNVDLLNVVNRTPAMIE